MNTVAYGLIAIGFIILAAATRGRRFTDLPGDLTDLAVGMATFDSDQVSEVLSRRGEKLSSTSGFDGMIKGVSVDDAYEIGKNLTGVGGSGKTVADLVALGKSLRAQGLIVAENKALGDNPRPGAHMASGWHYKHDNSGAIDVNHPNSSIEARYFDSLVPVIRRQGFHVLWRVSGHYNHMHVDISRRDI